MLARLGNGNGSFQPRISAPSIFGRNVVFGLIRLGQGNHPVNLFSYQTNSYVLNNYGQPALYTTLSIDSLSTILMYE